MGRMKNNAIVGHFDNEIDMKGLPGQNIKPQVIYLSLRMDMEWLCWLRGRWLNLGCATGHPSFVMSSSFTSQTLALIELWTERYSNKYERGHVYTLPKVLDEKVARLHLDALGVELTELSEEQAEDEKMKNHFFSFHL